MTFLTYTLLFCFIWIIACIACVVNTNPKKLRGNNTEAALLGNQVLQYKADNDLKIRVVGSVGNYAAVVSNENYLEFDDVVLIK